MFAVAELVKITQESSKGFAGCCESEMMHNAEPFGAPAAGGDWSHLFPFNLFPFIFYLLVFCVSLFECFSFSLKYSNIQTHCNP